MRGTHQIALHFITLLLTLDPLLAFSASASPQHSKDERESSFFRTVTSWLDEEKIAWRRLLTEKVFPRDIDISNPILQVSTSGFFSSSSPQSTLYYLHILKSPTSMRDCLSPKCARDMTNYVQFLNKQSAANKISIIHLHEDVWCAKTDIVQSRLRTRLMGGSSNPSARIYARKTRAKRIDAGMATAFLQKHHLWSATKARYYYGLFLPSSTDSNNQYGYDDDDDLVAVATFSTKRKILRGTRVTRSHELIRFCSRADSVVIGGITKLIRSFVQDQQPVDDIITVVDRDWGPGDGWHSIGFETLHVSAPVMMVVKDGIRRHLVGAGIQNNNGLNSVSPKLNELPMGRPGVEEHVLEELASLTTYQETLRCLEHHEYYPVFDSGVERLIMVVPNAQNAAALLVDEPSMQDSFVSTYAASYRTNNSGISAIFGHAMAQTAASLYGRYLSDILTQKANVNDSITAQSDANAWRATGGIGKCEKIVYRSPSSLDPLAFVEVKERPGGWCTVGIVGGATKSIRHGNFKVKEEERGGEGGRYIDSSVMVFEYLRSMAAMALVGLEFRRAHPDNDDVDDNANLSCLYLGYGAGSLPRFMASLIPRSQHVAVELDDGVASAAHQCRLLNHSLFSDSVPIELHIGDAQTYERPTNKSPFDIVFVDIFDDENILPPEFYSTSFLHNVVYINHLGGRPDGIVIHNFHTGGKALRSKLTDAILSYRGVFSTILTVESVDSRYTGGNTILLATNLRRLDATSETLSWRVAGKMAQQYSGVNFDVIARTNHKLWQS